MEPSSYRSEAQAWNWLTPIVDTKTSLVGIIQTNEIIFLTHDPGTFPRSRRGTFLYLTTKALRWLEVDPVHVRLSNMFPASSPLHFITTIISPAALNKYAAAECTLVHKALAKLVTPCSTHLNLNYHFSPRFQASLKTFATTRSNRNALKCPRAYSALKQAKKQQTKWCK